MNSPLFPGRGAVSLVGAGPGDPDLMTIKAMRLLQHADAVVYDHLVGEGILALIPARAEKIYVGKEVAKHTLPQAEINSLLVQLAMQGKQVVRLKGGDPFIFGRGGEEMAALAAAGIPCQVVPGVTAAAAAGAGAGIPLTHRDHAQACVLVTGHLKQGELDLDWSTLARSRQTIVFYMGLGTLDIICRELIAHGMGAGTPAAVVRHASLPTQETVTGTLDTLSDAVRRSGVQAPALIIVGSVVSLRETLSTCMTCA